MKKLTARHLRIAAWLSEVKPKTTEEIASRFLVCTRTARNYLSELQQRGLVEVRGRKGRQLTFTSFKREKDEQRNLPARHQGDDQRGAETDDPRRVLERA